MKNIKLHIFQRFCCLGHGVNVEIGINQNIRSGLTKHSKRGAIANKGTVNSNCSCSIGSLLLHKNTDSPWGVLEL